MQEIGWYTMEEIHWYIMVEIRHVSIRLRHLTDQNLDNKK